MMTHTITQFKHTITCLNILQFSLNIPQFSLNIPQFNLNIPQQQSLTVLQTFWETISRNLYNCLLKGLNTFGWGWGARLGRLLIPHQAGTGSMVLMGSDNENFFGLGKSEKYQINFKNYWKIPNMDSLCATSIFYLLT